MNIDKLQMQSPSAERIAAITAHHYENLRTGNKPKKGQIGMTQLEALRYSVWCSSGANGEVPPVHHS